MIENQVLTKLSRIKVLIAEDEEMTLFALEQSLSPYCAQVLTAKNGMEGFEIFEANKPDVIVVDINMPEMNGLEMIESIHNICPHLPVIIMTSYDNTENLLESINLGAYGYLRKPIRIEELQTAILMATKNIYNNQVKLQKNFVFDLQLKELKREDKAVYLTLLEKELLYLLASNSDTIINYSIIENYVWQEKSMSSASLRMCVKKIRKKTYSDIIENIPKCGYRISSAT